MSEYTDLRHVFMLCILPECTEPGEHCHHEWCGAPRNHSSHRPAEPSPEVAPTQDDAEIRCKHCGKAVSEGIGQDCFGAKNGFHDWVYPIDRVPTNPRAESKAFVERIMNEPVDPAVAPTLADSLREKGDKYREYERVARNEGNNSAMDSASGKASAFYIAARMASVPAVAPRETQTEPPIPDDLRVDWNTLNEPYVSPVTLEWAIERDKNMQNFAKKLILRVARLEGGR